MDDSAQQSVAGTTTTAIDDPGSGLADAPGPVGDAEPTTHPALLAWVRDVQERPVRSSVLRGVRYSKDKVLTPSMVMRFKSSTIRVVDGEHQAHKWETHAQVARLGSSSARLMSVSIDQVRQSATDSYPWLSHALKRRGRQGSDEAMFENSSVRKRDESALKLSA